MVNFKQLLEKATSADLSEPDWETILQIVEEVKTKSVSAKNAAKDIKRRLQETGGSALYHTVIVIESLMKNCTSDLHGEVLTADFLSAMKEVITSSKDGRSEKAVDKALELIGEWKAAFGEQTSYKAINTVFSELERSGYHIPVATVASAAFIKKPPEWVLSDHCFMCRQEFNRFKGKLRHHCRNCGKSVCATCSSKRTPLTHFGVMEPTRVCDICFKKVEKGEGESAASAVAELSGDLPVEYLRSSLAQESQAPPKSSGGGSSNEQKIQEEDDLQLAIAMSLNEQENKTAKKSSATSKAQPPVAPTPPPQSTIPSAPPPSSQSTLYASIMTNPVPTQEPTPAPVYSNGLQEPVPSSDDPLARYLDRNYWEQRKEEQQGGGRSTDQGTAGMRPTGPEAVVVAQQAQGPAANLLAESIKNSIDMFVKRLHEVNSKGGSIATDPVILSLYQNLTAMQPQLLKQIDDVQLQKSKQVAILNKLNEAKEARVTLNKMRREHQDKVKQMEQEQAMLARMQMEQKLALLRQQKQEQLEFQQNLQQKRLEVLQSQRAEYEQKIALQRELERKHLIEQEHKVMQHQFGPGVTSVQSQPSVSSQGSQMFQPPPAAVPQQGSGELQSYQTMQATSVMPLRPPMVDPSSLPMHSLSLQQQAPPLPSKVDYASGLQNPGLSGTADLGGPPPYNPVTSNMSLQDPLASSMYTSQPASMPQWTGAQPHLPPSTGLHSSQPPPPAANGLTSLPPSGSGQETMYSMAPPQSMQFTTSQPSLGMQQSGHSVQPSGALGQQPHQHHQQQVLPATYASDQVYYSQDMHSDLATAQGGTLPLSSQHSQAPPTQMGGPPGQMQMGLPPNMGPPPPNMGQVPMGQPPAMGQHPGQIPQQQGYGRQESEPPLISFD